MTKKTKKPTLAELLPLGPPDELDLALMPKELRPVVRR